MTRTNYRNRIAEQCEKIARRVHESEHRPANPPAVRHPVEEERPPRRRHPRHKRGEVL